MDGGAAGHVVRVFIDAVQTPVAGGGGSQETPLDQRVGIFGLTLQKGLSDPAPLVVFDHTSAVDTPYNAGSSTLVGSAPTTSLVAGTYTIARVPVGYVKFTVAGTYHLQATPVPGAFSDTIALTSGTTIDGAKRDRGWWSSSFSYDGTTAGPILGTDADIAQPAAGSGLGLDLSGPVAAYVFPVNLTIPSVIDSDLVVLFTVNTYQDFHWTDSNAPGYTAGVFDVSGGTFEPVTQLGANSFTVTIGPAH